MRDGYNNTMTYDDAMEYISKAGERGICPGLERMEILLNLLGNPERCLNVIHVAGTNGKGSVCAFISAILNEAGYRVGRYVSPAVYGYRERIQTDGEWISEDDTAKYICRIRNILENVPEVNDQSCMPTAFEIETAMAFAYFYDRKCDFVVLETGMGGRLDATNAVDSPVISVITSVGMDHMQFLGGNIAEIAAEKGGIIKEGCPAVICAGNDEAEQVLADICFRKKSRFRLIKSEDIRCHGAREGMPAEQGETFDYKNMKDIRLGMSGMFQCRNAAAAIEAVKMLTDLEEPDFPAALKKLPSDVISEKTVRSGLAGTVWHGRFETAGINPTVIIDGAHNPDGVKALSESLKEHFPDSKIAAVMGVFADKDYRQMLEIISHSAYKLITFTPDDARGLDGVLLAEEASACFGCVHAARDLEEALHYAVSTSDRGDVIVCFGSLSTVERETEFFNRRSCIDNRK